MRRARLSLLVFCLMGLCFMVSPRWLAVAQTTQNPAPVLPKYMILGVVYAPPGSSSFVTYGQSTGVGSATSITQTSEDGSTASVSSSFAGGFAAWNNGFQFGVTSTANDGWKTINSTNSSFSTQSISGNSISTLGPISSSLGVNHDNDVIYVILNPVLGTTLTPASSTFNVSWTGLASNSCDLNNVNDNPTLYQSMSSCDPNQYPYPDIIGIPVWCLKNPYFPGQGCAQWIAYTSRSWDHSYRGPLTDSIPFPEDPTNPPGLTLQDYADILRADPFVAPNGESVNGCHPTYGPNVDPNRPETMSATPQAGSIVSALMVSPGAGYSSAPIVTFSGGGATSNAIGIANMTGIALHKSVTSITLVSEGSGYTSAPTIQMSGGGGSGAEATAYLPYPVTSIFVKSSGSGYSSEPTVTFSGGGGSGATGVANMVGVGSNQSVASVTITNGGSGYISAPSISFSGGGGAAAVAYIPLQPVSCGATTGTIAKRFNPYGTVEYPVPGPNGLPSTYAGMFTYQQNGSSQTGSIDSHTVGYSVDLTAEFTGGASFLGAGAQFTASLSTGYSSSNTMTTQNSTTNSTSADYTANYSITGPQLSDNYSGPATYNVYWDDIYGTYAFYSDLESKVTLGNIGVSAIAVCPPGSTTCSPPTASSPIPINPIPAFSPTQVGGESAYQAVTLINNSGSPLTMVWPAITFDDPGFQLVQDSPQYPDRCSNQYLLPFGQTSGLQTYYCTLYIKFAPQISDAPNPITLANTPAVLATMIAAGTENFSPYQNILVTSQTQVSGVVATSVQGVTLIANANGTGGVGPSNPIPNVYVFPSALLGSSTQEIFTLTNYNTQGVTVTKVALTDSTNFGIYSDNCTGNSLAATGGAQTCTITVQFNPVLLSSAGANAGSYYAGINVSGTVGSSSGIATPAVILLATAGAVGSGPPAIAITDTTGWWLYSGNGSGPNDVVTFTDNIPGGTMALTIDFSNTGSSTTTCSLTVGHSCSVTVYAPGDCATGPNCPNSYDRTYGVSGVVNNTTYTNQFTESFFSTEAPPCDCTCNNNCTTVIFVPLTGSQSPTVIAGGTAQYSFQVSPGGANYPSVVLFSATGLPPGATANFSPPTIAANAGVQTVSLSIQTAAAVVKAERPGLGFGSHLAPALLALLFLPFTLTQRFRNARPKLARLLSVILLLTAFAGGGMIGCGSTGKGVTSSGGMSASHTYTITVTAKSGTVSQSITVPLTVQ